MPPDLEALRRRLGEIVGAEQVQAGPAVARFAVDGVTPHAAVSPRSQEEVQAVVAACSAAGAAMTPWGGGTAMETGNPPRRLDVVVRLDRLARVVELDEANLNVTAEAGVRLADLQALVGAKRELLPLDPPRDDEVTVGGLVAANATGPTRLLYGPVRDWVLGLRVVLAGGERIRCGGKVIKNVSGYDMNKLFIGSRGTLGVVTEVTLKLLPAPAARATVAAAFPGLGAVEAVVSRTTASQLLPEALEALDPEALRLVAGELCMSEPQGFGLAASLAGTRETVQRQVRDFERFFGEGGATARTTLDGARSEAAWRAIRNVHARIGAPREERVVAKMAVPIAKALPLLSAAEAMARSMGGPRAITAHAASGVVRAAFATTGAPAAIREGLSALRAEAEAAEGSLVLESAPPALKRSLDAWGTPRDALPLMRRVKAELDPAGLMSPGRFVGGM